MMATMPSFPILSLSSKVKVCGDRIKTFVLPYAMSGVTRWQRQMSSVASLNGTLGLGQIESHVSLYLEGRGGVCRLGVELGGVYRLVGGVRGRVCRLVGGVRRGL